MKGYEGTLSVYEFFQHFPTEESAYTYYENHRWPDGPVCPSCESQRISRQKDYRYLRCKDCRRKFTVRTNTVFESTHISLDKWLFVAYLMETARKGISSLQLSKELGITQKSAWFMLHRLREACHPDLPPLEGQVEIDESYLGGRVSNMTNARRKNHTGRGPVGKQPILGMRERDGFVVAFPVEDTKMATLEGKILDNVEPGTKVYTDESRSYTNLGYFFDHETVNHSAREFVRGDASTNSIESFWAVLKRSYHGTYHWWSFKHSHRYVNEAAFRLNEGNCRRHTLKRIDSLLEGAQDKRLKYKTLIS